MTNPTTSFADLVISGATVVTDTASFDAVALSPLEIELLLISCFGMAFGSSKLLAEALAIYCCKLVPPVIHWLGIF